MTAPLAMTIEQQNRLLSAVNRMDPDAAENMVKEIYEQIPTEKEALFVIVTKELLDLLERITLEHKISLDLYQKILNYLSIHVRKVKQYCLPI